MIDEDRRECVFCVVRIISCFPLADNLLTLDNTAVVEKVLSESEISPYSEQTFNRAYGGDYGGETACEYLTFLRSKVKPVNGHVNIFPTVMYMLPNCANRVVVHLSGSSVF